MSTFDSGCPFTNGMNLDRAEKLAKRVLGVEICTGYANGHHEARHPLAVKPCSYNCRKKSASRKFIGWCRDIWWLMRNDGTESCAAA